MANGDRMMIDVAVSSVSSVAAGREGGRGGLLSGLVSGAVIPGAIQKGRDGSRFLGELKFEYDRKGRRIRCMHKNVPNYRLTWMSHSKWSETKQQLM